MLATIMQKDVFDHNIWTKALRMTIWDLRSMFLRSMNLIVPVVIQADFRRSFKGSVSIMAQCIEP